MNNTKPSTIWINGTKPKLGDIASSKDVGRTGRAIHIWEACSDCGTERWIKRNTSGTTCKSCALRSHSFGENNRRWNSTRKTITKSGIRVYIGKGHPYFSMAHKCAADYAILEHRLVMAESLGRPLRPEEVVHHIDGNNLNNDLSNLQLLPSQAMHTAYTLLQVENRRLAKQIQELEVRVTLAEADTSLLRSQLEKLGYGNPELNP